MTLPFKFKKRALAYFGGTVGVSVVFFSASNPTHVPSVWLVLGFMLLVALLFWFIRCLIVVLGFYIPTIAAHRRGLERVLTGLIALLIAMQSVGQLTPKDVIVLLPLVVLAYLYVSYSKRTAPNR